MFTKRLCSLLVVLTAPGFAGPVRASPAPVTWPTFLRAGPAENAAVLDEMDPGTFVDVQSCDAGWCRVLSNRAIGYLPQALLGITPPTPAVAPGEQACFVSPTWTRHGEGALTFCPRP